MDGLLPLITGFGLAGAGGRASLVALLLGIVHYTPHLIGARFHWLASIPMLLS